MRNPANSSDKIANRRSRCSQFVVISGKFIVGKLSYRIGLPGFSINVQTTKMDVARLRGCPYPSASTTDFAGGSEITGLAIFAMRISVGSLSLSLSLACVGD